MPNGARTQITFSSCTLASSLVRVKLEWDLRKGCLSLWDEIESFKQLRHYYLVYLFAHDEINFPMAQGVDVNSHFRKKMKLKEKKLGFDKLEKCTQPHQTCGTNGKKEALSIN